jgi:phage protein U
MAGPVVVSAEPQRTTSEGSPRPGMVKLNPSRGSGLTLILNAPPDRTGGVGGFETVERQKRRPAKYWKGSPDDTISLDCLLDVDAIGGPSIERRLRVLRDMGLPGDEEEPPTITLDGDVWEDDKTVEWVFQSGGLSLGDRLWLPTGMLRRQQVKIDLERYEGIEKIEAIRVTSSRTSKGKRRRRTTIARGNDTLRGIALRELGDATRWKDLVRWNKKLKGADPDARLRTGLHITIR